MFKLFKRAAPPAKAKQPAPAQAVAPVRAPTQARARTIAASPIPTGPPPVEVREDHDESAWDLWEESNFQLDSQMGGLSASDSVRVRDARPSQAADLDDPFSRIGKNHR